MLSEVVEQVVDEVLLLGVKDLGNDSLVIASDDLSFDIILTMLVKGKE